MAEVLAPINNRHRHAAGDDLLKTVARELERLIEAVSVAYGETSVSAGASAGVVTLAAEAVPEQMIDAADHAMHARKTARKRGR